MLDLMPKQRKMKSSLDEARYFLLRELEEGNEEAYELLEVDKRNIFLKEFNKVYDIKNIKFDSYAGESFLLPHKMPAVIEELKGEEFAAKRVWWSSI